MLAIREHPKFVLGICFTWVCAGILYIGLTHATLDGTPFVFWEYDNGTNLLIYLTAPVAQSAFYILARRTSLLLNVYLALTLIFCVMAGVDLATGGYRFSYWHQGDYHCLEGCNDVWLFGYLVLLQGCALMFLRSVFNGAFLGMADDLAPCSQLRPDMADAVVLRDLADDVRPLRAENGASATESCRQGKPPAFSDLPHRVGRKTISRARHMWVWLGALRRRQRLHSGLRDDGGRIGGREKMQQGDPGVGLL